MALPISRNTTYAPGSQVKSADLNDVQDKIVALETARIALVAADAVLAASVTALKTSDFTLTSGKHFAISGTGKYKRGAKVRHIHPMSGLHSSGTLGVYGWVSGGGGFGHSVLVPLTVDEGERIVQLAARVDPAGGAAMVLRMMKYTDGTESQIGTVSSSGSAAQTLTLSGLTETIGGFVTTMYYAQIEAGQSSDAARALLLTTDVI